MTDLVERMIADGHNSKDIFKRAYETCNDPHVDPSNHSWSHALWTRTGIVTRTVEKFITEHYRNEQLPLDLPDHHHRLR
jgi:hypothetical protein